MTTSTYVDANLHHDQVTAKAATACLHMVNATPSHWHTKRQATVETATFGSEFVAARIATDQIIDLRYTLMYLGVPVRSKSYMFGDNKSVVDSASIPTSTLSKKSTLASYHRVLKPGAHPRVGNPEVTGIPQVDSSTRQQQLISTHAEVTYLTKPPITAKPVVRTN